MTLQWRSGNALESGGDLAGSQVSGSLQASERGEHLGIEVGGNMELVTSETVLHCGRHR